MASFYNLTYLATCPWPLTYDPRLANTTIPCNIICPLPMYGPDRDWILLEMKFFISLVSLVASFVIVLSQILLLLKRKKVGGDMVTTVLLMEFFSAVVICHLLALLEYKTHFVCESKWQAVHGFSPCWVYAFLKFTFSIAATFLAVELLTHTCHLLFFPKYIPPTKYLLSVYHGLLLGYCAVIMSVLSSRPGIYGGLGYNCGVVTPKEKDWWYFLGSYGIPAFLNGLAVIIMSLAAAYKIVRNSGLEGLIRSRRILMLVLYFALDSLLVEVVLFWQFGRRHDFNPRYESWVFCAVFQPTIKDKYEQCKRPLFVPYELSVFYTVFTCLVGVWMFLVFFSKEMVLSWRDLLYWTLGQMGLREKSSLFSVDSSTPSDEGKSLEMSQNSAENLLASRSSLRIDEQSEKTQKSVKSPKLAKSQSQAKKVDQDVLDQKSSSSSGSSYSDSSASERERPRAATHLTSPKREDDMTPASSFVRRPEEKVQDQQASESSRSSSSSASSSSSSKSSMPTFSAMSASEQREEESSRRDESSSSSHSSGSSA